MSFDQRGLEVSSPVAKGSRPELRQSERSLTVAGLFAGIGGIELGFARAGHSASLLCEIDRGAMAVLEARFANVPKHSDVTTLGKLPARTELIAAGFPCQDLSQAGKTEGISGARSGLVGQVFRLLERKAVPFVLLENVPFMLNLAKGRALEVIVGEFERLGYKWAYRVIDTRAFGLPQRRARVYFVACLDEDPRDILLSHDAGEPQHVGGGHGVACGFYWTEGVRGLGWAVDAVPTLKGGSTIGIPSPPAIVLPSGEVVKPDIRDAERLQGFDANWTSAAETVGRASHRWKLVGNAVTVNVAEWIAQRFARPTRYSPHRDRPLMRGEPWPRAAWNLGDGRFASPASAWPVHVKGPGLHQFLHYPTVPLSEKATAGFLARAGSEACTLRFPNGFIETIRAHLEKVRAPAVA